MARPDWLVYAKALEASWRIEWDKSHALGWKRTRMRNLVQLDIRIDQLLAAVDLSMHMESVVELYQLAVQEYGSAPMKLVFEVWLAKEKKT